MTTLADALEAHVRPLSLRCIDAMYRDPFWQARFGDRGRKHAEDDSAYHVKYVASALRASDAGVFRHYARWLRGVLVSRGMCSWHLAESFHQLGAAMHAELANVDHRAAIDVLAEGQRSLAYDEGDAAAVSRAMPALAARVRASKEAYRVDELLSFVTDALARGDGASVSAHVAFVEQALATPEERPAVRRTLDVIADAIAADISADAGARARDLVRC